MANISVTNTFSNSTTADATQVNQNFSDIINGTSDGTKDFSISALTVGGTLTANGNVNLGNASTDDLSITASLASSLAIKTTATYNVGSSTLGLLSVYLGNSTFTTRLLSGASSSWTMTLPVTGGTAGYALVTNGSGTTSWSKEHIGTATNDSATAGYIGEYTSASQTTNTNTPASDVYGDLGSISLTAGDWDVSMHVEFIPNGSTTTLYAIGVGTASGNSGTGLTYGTTALEQTPVANGRVSMAIPMVRISIASTTTYYGKIIATISAGTPQYRGIIQARRVR